ncbi:MAG: hypothetical protein ACXAE3_13685 [Candidatus Kariarchaeaceae archaeon]|jgi:hypothetical protein
MSRPISLYRDRKFQVVLIVILVVSGVLLSYLNTELTPPDVVVTEQDHRISCSAGEPYNVTQHEGTPLEQNTEFTTIECGNQLAVLHEGRYTRGTSYTVSGELNVSNNIGAFASFYIVPDFDFEEQTYLIPQFVVIANASGAPRQYSLTDDFTLARNYVFFLTIQDYDILSEQLVSDTIVFDISVQILIELPSFIERNTVFIVLYFALLLLAPYEYHRYRVRKWQDAHNQRKREEDPLHDYFNPE